MMTVLYILDYGTVGGATKAFIDLCHQMKKLDVVPVVVTGKRNELNELLEKDGIRTIAAGHYTALDILTFKSLKWPFRFLKFVIRYYVHEQNALKRVSRQVDFSKIDLIHTNSARNTLGCRLSKRYGIPHIVHVREFGDKDFDCIKLTPNYIKWLNNYSVMFLSVSQAVLEYWGTKGLDNTKNQVVYDGIQYYDITASPDSEKLMAELKMVINGGVYPTKGQHLIVEAMGMLPEDVRKHLTLDVVGWYGESYVEDMKKYATERGYGQQIKFLGARDDVHERMGLYQIGLMCSRSEGFGLVTAEYMHGQLGVIASDSGACPELIEDGSTGLLFKSGDSHDLARCIEMLYNDRQLLIRLSNNARKEAIARFTAKINADNIYAIYKKILKNK